MKKANTRKYRYFTVTTMDCETVEVTFPASMTVKECLSQLRVDYAIWYYSWSF